MKRLTTNCPDNNRTCRLKLRRGDVADILLHDEIKRQFDEQEAKRDD